MKKIKYIFIACAMVREAKLFIDKLNNIRKETVYGFNFYFGNLDDKNIIVGISSPRFN